jgi:hypothetical protein
MYREEDLPRNATYGDGSPIPEDDLRQIRLAFDAEEVEFQWSPNDILLLDNMRVAHARNPYKGKRRILAAMGRPSSSESVMV